MEMDWDTETGWDIKMAWVMELRWNMVKDWDLDTSQTQHRSRETGASPSLETCASPGHDTQGIHAPSRVTHPWDTQLAHRDTRDTHTSHAIIPVLLEPGLWRCTDMAVLVTRALGDTGSADAKC